MAPRLTANVVLRHPDSGAVTCLPSGSELPTWAVGQVGDHVLKGGSARPAASPASAAAEPTLDPPPSGGDPPPRSGKGSSDAAWTDYARSHGVQVTNEMTRREVIDACEKAGVPT